MIAKKDAIAMTEFLHYIKKFDDESIKKIPSKMMNFFKDNCDKNYECNFDYNKPLDELELTPETHALIGLVCYKYWCETDEDRSALRKKWKENEIIKEEKLREEASPENLFKTNRLRDEAREKELEESKMIVVDEPKGLFAKIVAFFKGIFKKNK